MDNISPTTTIIVTGKMQSGKSSTCEFLQDKLGGKIYNFATLLKEICSSVFNVPIEWCNGTNDDKNRLTEIRWSDLPLFVEQIKELFYKARGYFPPQDNLDAVGFLTVRELLQIFGSQICRKMMPNCWVLATKNKIRKEFPKFAFIADARFKNEIDCLLDIDPIIIKLKRQPIKNEHQSEKDLDDYDFSTLSKYIEIDNTNLSMDDKHSLIWNRLQEFIK